MSKKIGFTIGKFAPFHKGHEFLINEGLKDMDLFYVVVYDSKLLNLDIETKIKWIKNRFPNVRILKAFNSPSKFGIDSESVQIQMEYLKSIIEGINVTHFYSSEEYGKYVASSMGIKHILVDKDRKNVPISATIIRENISKKKIDNIKEFLNSDVFETLKKN